MGQRSSKPILFLHFHKSGGTSIVQMFEQTGISFYKNNINGNPWSADWQALIKFWNFDRDELVNWTKDLREMGVEFIACEWNFLQPATRAVWSNFDLITCLRDPFARLLSDYSAMGGDSRWGRIDYWYNSPSLIWERMNSNDAFPVSHNMENHYVRILNGLGDKPSAKLDTEQLLLAKDNLRCFDSILILEHQKSFDLLGKYDVHGPLVHTNRGRADHIQLPSGFEEEFRLRNQPDYELYKYASDISDKMIRDL